MPGINVDKQPSGKGELKFTVTVHGCELNDFEDWRQTLAAQSERDIRMIDDAEVMLQWLCVGLTEIRKRHKDLHVPDNPFEPEDETPVVH